MKTYTIDDIRNMEPCYDPVTGINEDGDKVNDGYLPADWSGTVVDVLKVRDCPHSDRLWVAQYMDVPTEIWQRWARWCALQVADRWECTNVCRRWLETGDESLREQARSAAAADAAARYAAAAADAAAYAANAARYAARYAAAAADAAAYAANAARYAPAAHAAAAHAAAANAARCAANATWYAAWDAARYAADAARDAARHAQVAKLVEVITEVDGENVHD